MVSYFNMLYSLNYFAFELINILYFLNLIWLKTQLFKLKTSSKLSSRSLIKVKMTFITNLQPYS